MKQQLSLTCAVKHYIQFLYIVVLKILLCTFLLIFLNFSLVFSFVINLSDVEIWRSVDVGSMDTDMDVFMYL